MIPKDIPPAPKLNVLIGAGLLLIGTFVLLPVLAALHYDGLEGFLSPLIIGLTVVGWLLGTVGLRVMTQRITIGAEVAFDDAGFTLNVRSFFKRARQQNLVWTDIEEMKLVEAPRGGDVLAFRLTHEAAIREGLIQPTTREDAAKVLVPREITLPLRLCGVSINEAVARFLASAKHAGATPSEQSSLNAVVYVRKLWTVDWS